MPFGNRGDAGELRRSAYVRHDSTLGAVAPRCRSSSRRGLSRARAAPRRVRSVSPDVHCGRSFVARQPPIAHVSYPTSSAVACDDGYMRFVVRGRHGGRRVSVTWEDGRVWGDEPLVSNVRAMDGVGEPVADTPEGMRYASLASPEEALDTIAYLMGSVESIMGDLPPGVLEGDYVD
jgi:hypothetical protein